MIFCHLLVETAVFKYLLATPCIRSLMMQQDSDGTFTPTSHTKGGLKSYDQLQLFVLMNVSDSLPDLSLITYSLLTIQKAHQR